MEFKELKSIEQRLAELELMQSNTKKCFRMFVLVLLACVVLVAGTGLAVARSGVEVVNASKVVLHDNSGNVLWELVGKKESDSDQLHFRDGDGNTIAVLDHSEMKTLFRVARETGPVSYTHLTLPTKA